MERVADPAPSTDQLGLSIGPGSLPLALTTSSPPNWIRLIKASRFSLLPRTSLGCLSAVCRNAQDLSAHDGRLALSQQGQDGDTGVSTDDGNLVLVSLGGLAEDGRDEGGSSDNVEVGDTEQPVG